MDEKSGVNEEKKKENTKNLIVKAFGK